MTSALSRIGERLRATTTLTAAAACLAVGGVASSAHAQAIDSLPSVTVRYDDLNLASERGSQELYSRIVFAAREVCAAPDIRDLAGMAAAKVCREQAIAKAVNEVRSPKLAALYAEQLRHG
jgi:UrcA family protein